MDCESLVFLLVCFEMQWKTVVSIIYSELERSENRLGHGKGSVKGLKYFVQHSLSY